MHYIVDGYNFFFRLKSKIFPLEEQRTSFIAALSSLLQALNISASIVFDSSNKNGTDIASISHMGKIDIIFTPKGTSGDDYIIELTELQKHPATITVVSSDNGVRARAASLGAHTHTIETFVKLLQQKNKKRTPAHEKLTADSPLNIDRLEKIFNEKLKDS